MNTAKALLITSNVLLIIAITIGVYLIIILSTGIDKENLEGVYLNEAGGYYCVYTKYRLGFMIQDTDAHEECHARVDDDYEHFCEYK